MLRPIKNFLTYLQKNATGANIFGVSSYGINESNEMNSSSKVQNEISEVVSNDELLTPSTSSSSSLPSLPSLKTHDQNENEVIGETNDGQLQEIEKLENPIKAPEKVFIDLSFEPEIIISENEPNETYNSDPLVDPLAIDDNFPVGELSVPITSLTSKEDEEYELLYSIDIHVPASSVNSTQQTDESTFNESTSKIRLDDTSEEQEIRSEGSDSGLGSETTTTSVDTNTSTTTIDSPINVKKPLRSNLKRRGDDIIGQIEKKPKRSINFDGVKVYYFPRMQGFGCVPSQGGCTLGMGARHISWRSFTMAEHVAEQRRAHRQQMQEINPRASSSDETDSEDELTEASGSDLDADTNGFLQPVHAKQRRIILKAAGVRKIDLTEKDECRSIRNSREFCGCSCRGFCDPDTCACSQAGIKCQVDRQNFPCGCTHDGCGNVVGRVEFNPSRVRTHYIHTKMRLGLEQGSEKGLDHLDSIIGTESISVYANNGHQIANNCSNNMSNYSLGNNLDSRSINYMNAQNLHSNMHQNNYNHNLYSNIIHTNNENGHHSNAPTNLPIVTHSSVDNVIMSSHDNLYSHESSLSNNLVMNNAIKSMHYRYRDISANGVESLVNSHMLDYPLPANTSKLYSPYDVAPINSYVDNRYLSSTSNSYPTNPYSNYPECNYLGFSSNNDAETSQYNNGYQHHNTQLAANNLIHFSSSDNTKVSNTDEKLSTIVSTSTPVNDNLLTENYQLENPNISKLSKEVEPSELVLDSQILNSIKNSEYSNYQNTSDKDISTISGITTQSEIPQTGVELPLILPQSSSVRNFIKLPEEHLLESTKSVDNCLHETISRQLNNVYSEKGSTRTQIDDNITNSFKSPVKIDLNSNKSESILSESEV